MKRLVLLSLFSFLIFSVNAQPYGNEWIPFSQSNQYSTQRYFKIKVWKDGIYKVTKQDLQSALVPLTSINTPKNFQLFKNGAEQYIHVEGENDNSFDNGDYILFHGQRNDGWFDKSLYADSTWQVNPRFSMYNDTAVYYLTWNNSQNNRRMTIENDVNFNAYTADPYFFKEDYKEYTAAYSKGYRDNNSVSDASFIDGEGYSSTAFTSTTFNVSLSTPNVYSAGPNARLRTAVLGANALTHNIELLLNTFLVEDTAFSQYNKAVFSKAVGAATLASATTTVGIVSIPNSNNLPNYISVPYVSINYPHSSTFAGEAAGMQKIMVDGSLSGLNKSYLEISGFDLQGSTPELYLIRNNSIHKIPVINSGGVLKALVPSGTGKEDCILLAEVQRLSSVTSDLIVEPVSNDPTNPSSFAKFYNFSFPGSDGKYIIISHPLIWDQAILYRNYRQTSGHDPVLVNINELYEQFAYGVRKHPLAIRNFCDFAIDTWSTEPEHLFLLGKSINANKSRNNVNYIANLVPTYGEPASDIMMTARLNSNRFVPELSTGRLAARNSADVDMYLDKVMSYESQSVPGMEPPSWMKKVLHFSGGSNSAEQELILQNLNNYKGIIEDTLFGAEVITYKKTSSSPIQINQSAQLQETIDNGVSLMTFFAHAAGTSFDISTDQPVNYNNEDRYPVIIANSCFVGDVHNPSRLASEDFVFQPKKGAIAFIAEPGLGYIWNLNYYTSEWYRQIAYKNYGAPLGSIMMNTIDQIISSDFYVKSVCMGMTLHGDPALAMNSHEKPDLVIEDADIFFTPNSVSNAIDSFDVNIVVTNVGRGFKNDFTVELKRYLPDVSSPVIFTKSMKQVPFRDTLVFTLPVDIVNAAGLNTFEVRLDAFGFIDEISESNNFAVQQLNIGSSDIQPIYPPEYAIVPDAQVVLKAISAQLFAPEKTYVFELDTLDSFASGFKQQALITQTGGVIEWNVPVTIDSNKVYYWRVGRDSVLSDTVNYVWRESSFIYIPNKTGWSQAHFDQFKNDAFENVVYNKTARRFDFVTTQSILNCKNAKNPFVAPVEYSINNLLQDYGACQLVPSVHVAVLDSIDITNPWETGDYFNQFGNINQYDPIAGTGVCRNRSEKYFIFRANTQAQLDALQQMINAVPNGNYLLVWSVFGGKFSDWSANGLDLDFVNMGSTLINTIQDDQPLIFFTRKGSPGTTVEIAGDNANPNPELTIYLGGNWKSGFVASTTIGPAKKWESLHWDQHPLEGTQSTQDSISLDVIGIASNGAETVLLDNLSFSTPTTYNLDQQIDAAVYPYLKLRAYVQDDSLRSPPQLKKWQILYEDVPEAALNPNKHFSFTGGEIVEGQYVDMEIAIENISRLDMDSMLVDFFLYDQNNQKIDISSPRYKPLVAGDTIIAKVRLNTKDLAGMNSLWIEANPNKDQLEQYHPNNIGNYNFSASGDVTNPILDVTFDGLHILDGDIVSAKPDVLIQLHDENKYLALNDTNKFRLFLRYPSGENRRLRFEELENLNSDPLLLSWQKATLPRNSFQILFTPELLEDGLYSIDVEASDESGNLSGTNNFTISFEVINRSTITEVINYPNPFSTSTRFLFTLTGSEIPDYFKIQIMTVSGKIIREITQSELGPLHVGRNLTDYAWDGRDEFGDRLANGVYLYRVVSTINGEKIEERGTAAGQYFKKGYGKMVILR